MWISWSHHDNVVLLLLVVYALLRRVVVVVMVLLLLLLVVVVMMVQFRVGRLLEHPLVLLLLLLLHGRCQVAGRGGASKRGDGLQVANVNGIGYQARARTAARCSRRHCEPFHATVLLARRRSHARRPELLLILRRRCWHRLLLVQVLAQGELRNACRGLSQALPPRRRRHGAVGRGRPPVAALLDLVVLLLLEL